MVLWRFRTHTSFQCFGELMAWIIKNDRDLELFTMFVWSIWTQWNQLRTQQSCCPTTQLAQFAKDRFNEFKAIKPVAHPRQRQQWTSWSPPAQNVFKIKYDGALYSNTNKSVEIEALAAACALEFAADIGLDNVIVEGDSLVVTQALKTKVVGLAAYGLLIKDAFSLAGNFSEVFYSHTKREGNKVAHCLAKLAVNLAECVIWMEEVPPTIYHLVQVDLALLVQ
ncbi:uncharacterized protein LOC115963559 [Quercus lobata]|uniref:uncharacterized protein LOC115963559 n=1 Tax=Quercus lobata TaxID=97700 RepID=UPI001243A735|nr:uncharacterized protein LOC115963559 [Quercus lobata]